MHKLLILFKLVILILAASLFFCTAAFAGGETPADVRLAQTASGRNGEYVMELSDDWKFGGKDLEAEAEDFDDSLWNTVNLPHTWNVEDGADGGSDYISMVVIHDNAIDAGSGNKVSEPVPFNKKMVHEN